MASPAGSHLDFDPDALHDNLSCKNDELSNTDEVKIFDDEDSPFLSAPINRAEDQDQLRNLGPQASDSTDKNIPTTVEKNNQMHQKSMLDIDKGTEI